MGSETKRLAADRTGLIFSPVVKMPTADLAGEGRRNALVAISSLLLLALVTSSAWVSEDAHITIRTVDNFVNGNGLRWNVDERVQTYTHPLWMMIVTPVYLLTREIYFTLTALCLCCSIGAYLIIARGFRHDPLVLLLAVFAPWALSRSLVRYATSGFENPLTFLLLASFAMTLLATREDDVPWGRLALLAALAAVGRLDTVLLYAPALAFLIFAHWRQRPWARLALGFTPLVAWLLFSLVYYGFPFPNTAYAKLSSAFPRSAYLERGMEYLADLFVNDPVSALVLSIGVGATVVQLLVAAD